MNKVALMLFAAVSLLFAATLIAGYNQFSYNRWDYRYSDSARNQELYNRYYDTYYTGRFYNPNVQFTGPGYNGPLVSYGGSNYYAPRYRGGVFPAYYSAPYPTGYVGGNFNAGSYYNRGFYSRSLTPYFGGCRSDYFVDGYFTRASKYCSA